MGLASFTNRILGHGAAADFVAAAVSATKTVATPEHVQRHAANQIEAIFCHVLHVASKYVNFFGGLILIGGIILSALNTGLSIMNMANWKCTMLLGKKVANLRMVRFQLGEITALALEILVVSDILETLVKGAYLIAAQRSSSCCNMM